MGTARHDQFIASKALGRLMGLRIYDRARPSQPAPYLIHNRNAASDVLFLVFARDKTSITFRPYDDENGWDCLVWAYKFLGIPKLDTSKSAADNARYLIRVLQSPVLLSAFSRYRKLIAETSCVTEQTETA